MAFLQWLTSAQFAELYTNALPGFFSLSNHFFEVSNPAAREMMEWRDQCDSTIRVATQILSRGEPKLGDELASQSQAVLLGNQTPQGAATLLEQELKSWYAPHQGSKVKGAACQCEGTVASSDPLATGPVVDETLTAAPAQTPVPVQAEGSVAEAAPLPAASPQTEAALARQLEGTQ